MPERIPADHGVSIVRKNAMHEILGHLGRTEVLQVGEQLKQ
jgi:hypothetical protein